MRLILLGVVLLARSAVAQQISSSDAITRTVEEFRSGGHIPGIAVAVVQDGKITHGLGLGLAEVDNNVPVTESTVFRVNSITKALTATAVLQLIERTNMRLDDRLSKYFPQYTRLKFDPTIYQLLTHTAGLTNYRGASFHKNIREDLSAKQWVDSVNDEHLYIFEPGSDWSYSNVGYDLLGLIVEKVSGVAFEQYLKANILDPAGMKQTDFCNTRKIIKNRAFSYKITNGGMLHAESWGTYGNASARLCSTALELAKFFQALSDGKLISSESLTMMRNAGHLSSGQPFDYGFGTRRGHFAGRGLIAHTGSGEEWSSALVHVPQENATVIVLCNADREGFAATALANKLLALIVATGKQESVKDLPVPAEIVKKMQGKWPSRDGPDVEILSNGDRLTARPVGIQAPPLSMRYQGDGRFRFDDGTPLAGSEIEFDPDYPDSLQIYHDGIFAELGLRNPAPRSNP